MDQLFVLFLFFFSCFVFFSCVKDSAISHILCERWRGRDETTWLSTCKSGTHDCCSFNLPVDSNMHNADKGNVTFDFQKHQMCRASQGTQVVHCGLSADKLKLIVSRMVYMQVTKGTQMCAGYQGNSMCAGYQGNSMCAWTMFTGHSPSLTRAWEQG